MIFSIEFVGAIWSKNDKVCNFWWIFWELRRCSWLSPHTLISFSHSKWFEKNYTSISWWYIPNYLWKKIRVFWAFWLQHSNFNVCTKYYLTKHFSLILSIMAFSWKLCNFIDLFLENYIILLSFQRWQSTKVFHTNDTNEELCLLH